MSYWSESIFKKSEKLFPINLASTPFFSKNFFALRKTKPREIEKFLISQPIKIESTDDIDDLFSDDDDALYSNTDGSASFNKKEREILTTHSNTAITNFIQKIDSHILDLTKNEKKLLSCFDEFYKSFRYGRFHPKNIDSYNKDSAILNDILVYCLKINTHPTIPIYDRKEHALYNLGICINNLSHKYYTVIAELASEMNIFTYELHDASDAQLVFWNNECSLHDIFFQNRIAREELFYYFSYDEIKKIIKKIFPEWEIPLPLGLILDNVVDFLTYGNNQSFVDSVNESLEDWAEACKDSAASKQKIKKREEEIHALISHFQELRE